MTMMSVPPSSALYLSSATTNGGFEHENFSKFFHIWISEQNQHLHDLISAAETYQNAAAPPPTLHSPDHQAQAHLRPLIDRVMKHYEHYYHAKSMWAQHDVLSMLTPSWRSSLEDAFLWIGGWRPSMAFHLLYSKAGLQFEAQLGELLSGINTGDLGDLSPSQLSQVDKFQRLTIREEKQITEEMAKQQEKVADKSMVELSHVITEMSRSGRDSDSDPGRSVLIPDAEEQVQSTLAPKKEGMMVILKLADDLRLRTLKNIIDILTPIQAVHFLIAAAELHLRIHDWGKKRDSTLYPTVAHNNNHSS